MKSSLVSFFLQILIFIMCGYLKDKGHTKYIVLNTLHID